MGSLPDEQARFREALGDLPGLVENLGDRKLAAGQARAQRLALEQLRDQEGCAAMSAEVEDGEDVRV